MWEKVKKKFEKTFLEEYIIVRNKLIPWQMIYIDRIETRIVLGKSEFLSKVNWFGEFKFSDNSFQCYNSNLVMSWVLMKILIRKSGNQFKYKRISSNDLDSMSELTSNT